MSPPNQLTLLRVLLTPIFAALILADSPAAKEVALAVFIIAALTDWYDGWVARRWGYITRWGKFLDPLADKILTSTAFIVFIAIGYADAWMVWIIVVRDLLVTLLRSYGEYKQRPVDTSRFAKTKTLVQMFVIYAVLVVYVGRTSRIIAIAPFVDRLASREVIYALMLVTTILTAWTGILYFIGNWRTIRELFTSDARATETER